MKAKNKILIAIIVLLIAFPSVIKSQTSISGYVRDAQTNEPLQGVTFHQINAGVMWDSTVLAITSNVDGYYLIPSNWIGYLWATLSNYTPVRQSVSTSTTTLDFYLEPFAPPFFTSAPVTTATQGILYSYSVTADDNNGDPLTYTALTHPGWLSFDTETQILSGTPGNEDVGGNDVTLRVTDGTLFVDQSFSIMVANVNDAPVLIEIGDQTTNEDTPLIGLTVDYMDIDVGETHTIDIVSNEPLVTVENLSGQSSGSTYDLVPGGAWTGTAEITVTVSDGNLFDSETYTLTVNEVSNTPTVITHGPTDVYETIIVVFGEVSDEGSSPVTDRGMCLSLSPDPDLGDIVSHQGSGPGFFTSQFSYLMHSTTYYYCAFATNAEGTSYGEVQGITTMPSSMTLTETISHVSCNGSGDGRIEIDVSGGLPPYTYSWSHGASTQDISSLDPGIYSVNVTDSEYDQIAGTYEVLEPAELDLSTSIVNNVQTCNGDATGSIQLIITGGTSPYTIEWEHGPTIAIISDLAAGNYDVLVTDSEGCEQTASYTLTEPDVLTASIVDVTNETCSGCADASITAAALGGTPPYTYNWTGPDGYSSVGALGTIADLSMGDYYLIVSDANACTSEALDVYVGNPLVVTNTNDSGDGSLRQAILDANANPGKDYIHFDITGDWVHTIRPATPLPPITDSLVIDGFTQPNATGNINGPGLGFNTDLKIELEGTDAGTAVTGLMVYADNCEFMGLVINRFSSHGMAVYNCNNNLVKGCFIGVDALGSQSSDYSNVNHGIDMYNANNNEIRNCIISANGGTIPKPGISISQGSTLNLVAGNLIGTDISGTLANPNTGASIEIGDAPGNTIGGLNDEDRNIICGRIEFRGTTTTANKIIGNYIGPDVSGQTALNQRGGILISGGANNNEIGPANVISGNSNTGLWISDPNTSNIRIFGNYFGLAADGDAILSNGSANIIIQDAINNRIGGLTADSMNVISGSPTSGFVFGQNTYGNHVLGNYIGTNAAGDQSRGNLAVGILIGGLSHNNTIGPGNLISGNGSDAINIGSQTDHTHIIGNLIGTDYLGTSLIANQGNGVSISSSSSNTIEGNTICGAGNGWQDSGSGIAISGVGSNNNNISDNLIGTNVENATEMGNELHGIDLRNGAHNTIIGPYNTISGNTYDGIHLENINTDSTRIFENYIGTAVGNPTDIGNGAMGIVLSDSVAYTTIGPGNVVSGNGQVGIHFQEGSSDNRIIGNRVGTTVDGLDALGNGGIGILIVDSPDNVIGGTDPEDRNVLSGNGMEGLALAFLPTTNNLVIGNYIGTDITGNELLQNGSGDFGINGAPNNIIGGLNPGERNVIASMSIGNSGAKWNRVSGNYFGLRADGQGPLSEEYYGAGVFISETSDNIIGPGNVFGGLDMGVFVHVPPGGESDSTVRNSIIGNFIGTNPDGTTAIHNRIGLQIEAKQNLIGGYTAEERNIISGNDIGVNIFGEVADSNIVVGNYIGTDYLGETAIPNNNGVWITDGNDNFIGGATEEARNIISGNNDNGIWIQGNGPLIADGNKVQGNFIGLAANGTDPLGNGGFGVKINAAAGNLIGGPEPQHRNIISANGTPGMNRFGIYVEFENSGVGNIIQGNYVGTDVSGMLDVGNISVGILINNASNIKILDNVVSGNAAGISLWQGEPVEPALNYENIISGNKVGLNADLSGLLGNDFQGISVYRSSNNVIGGTTLSEANIIGGNGGTGIMISHNATGNEVLGNYIGVDPTGIKTWPNEVGIQIDTFATNNQVGDLNGNENFIAYNDSAGILIGSGNNDLFGNEVWSNGTNGIEIYGDIDSETENNRLSQNLIYNNGALGIDLNSDGVTENDLLPLDPDEGPNHLQNFPVLDSVSFAEGNVIVEGHLWTKSDTIYVIEFFGSSVSDGTGFGEGEFYLGSDTVHTDVSGYASFFKTLPTQGYGAQVITATATDLNGNTSEFSQIIGGEKDQVLAEMPFRYTLNNEGLPTVPLADYQEAIRSAFQTWDDIPIAEIEMEDAGESELKYASATDGVNLVSFQDDRFPFAKGVLAVTAKTLRMSSGGTVAEIVDADIVFNPAYIYDEDRPFAVLEEGDTDTEAFDIQTVATHEIGHVLGMIHSGVYSSTMFFMLGSGTTERELDADDMAWASFRYPMEDFQATHGLISGRITYGDIGNVADPSTHPPVAGALVLAIDTLTREMIHAYTDADGNYTVPIPLEGVGTARYWIYIQPLDGDVYGTALNPANISPYIYSHTRYTDFPEEFYDELESADDEPRNGVEIQVSAGAETSGIDLITNRDQTPPTVIGVSPALGDTGVAVSPTLAIKFSEPVDIYSFNDTTCYLESTGGTVGSEYTLLADSTHIVLMKPLESLLYSTEYTLHISEILDLKNNELATDYSSSFTTQAPDTLAPAVYDVIPADSTTQVDVTKPVKVFFSKPMTKTSVETAFTMMTIDSTLVTGDYNWDLANKEMTYSPDYSLEEGTEYVIGISTQALDLAGNAMVDDTTFRFFTVNVAKPQILYLGPEQGSSGITVETPVVVKFSEPMDLTSINAGSFSLSDTEGPVSGSYEYLDQGRTIVFRPDQSLIFNEDYTVNLTSNISDKSDPHQYLLDTTTTFHTAVDITVPHIDYMDPPFGAVGAQVSIVGSGFDPAPLNNTVLFDGLAAHVGKASLESLTVNVPYEAVDGPVTISVNGVAADNSFEFDVVPPNTDPSYSVIASSKTGSKTRAVVINPDAGYAYVTNWGDNTVTPIDISGNIPEPGTDIPVGIEPMDIDLNPAGTLAYVTNFLSNTVSVIGTNPDVDSTFHKLTKDIPVGYHPYGIAASSDKKVYVANNESEYVSVIDVDSNSGGFDHVIANVKTGSKNRSIVVTPDAALILVTGEDGVKIIDRDPLSPEFNDVIASASKGSSTRHVTITPDAALALATTDDGVILIIDIFQPRGTDFGKAIASVKTGSSARNINISPDAMYVYITNPDENTVSVYKLDYSIVPGYGASLHNPEGLVHITTIAVDDTPYAIIGHPNNEYLLVTHDSEAGGVSKISTGEGSIDLIETLEELIVSVQDARDDRLIRFLLGRALLFNLNQTLNRVHLDLPLAAIISLDKFIRKVHRNLLWGRIPTDLGEAWLETAYMIREQLLKDYQEKLSQLKGSQNGDSGISAMDDPQSISSNEKDLIGITSLKLENRPNPFSYHTQIIFEIPNSGQADIPVVMRVFNINGQVVKTLVQKSMAPGRYSVQWNSDMDVGGSVPNGIYLLELMTPDQRKAIRISVIK